MKFIIGSLLFMLFFSSCEKTIHLQINNQSPKLVVDGSIENGKFPIIILSSSLNYFSAITPAQLSASFVHNAKITITDGALSDVLKEYEYVDSTGTKLYLYSVDSSNLPAAIVGQFNHQYNLTIQTADSAIYTATTTIPLLTKLCDSLWWQPAPHNTDTTLAEMFGKFTDPPGYGNYVRYFTKVNSEPFYPGLTSAFDDEVVDGTTYDLQIPRSYSRNDSIKLTNSDYGFYHHGDTVSLKFCNIDKATFNFWNTWEYSFNSNGNPFSSPVTVLSNISNGALGVFCGYAAQYKTLIIPR